MMQLKKGMLMLKKMQMRGSNFFVVILFQLSLMFVACQRKDNIERIVLKYEMNITNHDSIEFLYTKINDSVLSVKRTYYLNKIMPFSLCYYLKSSNNGSVKIGFVDVDEILSYQDYLSFNGAENKHVDFQTVKYADSRMKYVGFSQFCINKKMVRLYKFVGKDIGPKCRDTTFYYFDYSSHLHIIECSGFRMISNNIQPCKTL
jgi:hypothetical protein